MAKKLLSVALMLLLTSLVTPVPASAQSQEDTRARQAQKVKARISKLGTGKRAYVEVKLRDNNKLKGYVSEIADDHFVVIDPKTNVRSTVPYAQVQQIKVNNHSLGYGLAFGAAVIGGVIIAVSLLLRGS